MVTPDGMPLAWIGRLGGHKNMTRVCGSELMMEVFKASVTKGYRHYLYGGNEGVPELLKEKMEAIFPGIKVVGTYSPPFRPLTDEEDEAIVKSINETKPDIVWVGIGAPKQERWMSAHLNRLEAPVMVGVGAAFDFNSNLKKRAPMWIQKVGMEWFFRLATEPRRLWRRYLKNNPMFVFLTLRQALGLKRYPKGWL
jgi:N-acetylglucosaminyldiphosphoundecaprenol N-acetyl-beta-D-mannosaminyltransferase